MPQPHRSLTALPAVALVSAVVVLTGAAIVRGGAAAADSNQDDQFLALLNKEGIPALSGVPTLVATAHDVCRLLDAGMPVDAVVKALVNYAYSNDPTQDLGRYERTETRFVHAAVGAYCPSDQGKIASSMANPAAGWDEPTHRVAAYTHNAVHSGRDLRAPHLMDGGVFVAGRCGDDRSDCDARGTVLTSLTRAMPGGVTSPNPPQIPAPPPPTAQSLTPPRPIAAWPPPKQPPPRPQQVEDPPQQAPPPPQQPLPPPEQPPPPPQQVEPSPTPPMPPAFVTLAP